jgi:hypothetical protein
VATPIILASSSSKVSSACCVSERARLAISISAFFRLLAREFHSRQPLTSRLLAFSRQQPLAPQALDANKLVAGICELLRMRYWCAESARLSCPALGLES